MFVEVLWRSAQHNFEEVRDGLLLYRKKRTDKRLYKLNPKHRITATLYQHAAIINKTTDWIYVATAAIFSESCSQSTMFNLTRMKQGFKRGLKVQFVQQILGHKGDKKVF